MLIQLFHVCSYCRYAWKYVEHVFVSPAATGIWLPLTTTALFSVSQVTVILYVAIAIAIAALCCHQGSNSSPSLRFDHAACLGGFGCCATLLGCVVWCRGKFLTGPRPGCL